MSSLVLEALGWALVHLLWQGTLVALALALALRMLGRRAATARYALACGALVMMLALPVATGWRHAALTQRQAPAVATRALPLDAPAPAVLGAFTASAPRAAPQLASPQEAAPVLERVLASVSAHMPWLVLVWGLGVALSSLRLLAGWLRLRRQVREASPVPAEWQERLDGLSRRLGLRRAVRLLQSAALEVPSAVGWLRPVVLLPASALTGLPARQLEMILAHELAHIRRYDFVVNVVQMLVETLLFYHPAVWWVSRAIRVEREHCCDDIAASASGSSLSYARALTALEELRVLPTLAPEPALSALGGSLPERVRRLVVSPTAQCSSRWVAGASLLTLVSSLAVAAPMTALVLPSEPERPTSPSAALAKAPPAPAVIASVPAPAPAPAASPAPAPASTPAAVPALPPAPTPIAAPAPAPVLAPLAVQPPAPARPVAAAPKPQPNPNPNPNPDAKPRRGEKEDADERTRLGRDKLSVDQLIALKVAGVTPSMVEKLEGMGFEPTVSNLVQFGHAGITPEYAKDMNARFGRKLSAEELVQMKHLGVTPEWIEAMKALGFAKASPEALISARAVGVDEAYLRKMKDAGLSGLDLETVTEMRAVGVKPETLSELAAAGYPKLSMDKLVAFHALGVNTGYIRALREAGLKDLPAEQLIELRAMGVNPDFIREMREAGMENLSVEELIRLRTSGIDSDFIRRLKQPRK